MRVTWRQSGLVQDGNVVEATGRGGKHVKQRLQKVENREINLSMDDMFVLKRALTILFEKLSELFL